MYRVEPTDAGDVWVDVPNGVPTFHEPPGFIWTRAVAFHEIGHVVQRLLRRRDPARDWYGEYWRFRDFESVAGTWQQALAFANNAWVALPDESWAEACGASIAGRWIRHEKTLDYGKPVGAMAARAFFRSLTGAPMSYPIVWRPSPNFTVGWWATPTNIAYHSAASTLAALLATFASSAARVSSHFTVDPGTRTIYQHVDLANRCWGTAGANDFTVAIEHVDGGPWGPHPELTYDMSAWLTRDVIAPTFGLSINEEVCGPHSRWTATACPAALDWRRIVSMAGGGDMAYLTEEQFNAWRVLLQKQLDTTLVQRPEYMRHIVGHSGLLSAKRQVVDTKLVIPELPKAAKPTAKQLADARKGHGKGKMRGRRD